MASVPSAPREGGGALTKGRGIPPVYFEEAMVRGSKRSQREDGVVRTIHTLGELEVVPGRTRRLSSQFLVGIKKLKAPTREQLAQLDGLARHSDVC